MRVFFAGATGVIGRRAVPLLVQQGHHVTGVARSPAKRAGLERLGATPVVADLFDAAGLARAVAGHDVVINLATHIPPPARMLLPWAWRENDRLRREASANLAAAAQAAGAGQFIQESFAPIYGDGGDAWIDERAPVRPVRYNRTTLAAERAAARFSAAGGSGVVLRFAAFYGPDAAHVADTIRVVRKGWVPLPGPATAFFSSVSHDDAATAVVAAVGAAAGTYNVVDDEPLRHREYVDALALALGVAPPRLLPTWAAVLFGSLGKMLARSLRISNGKLKQQRGWAPRYPSAREGWRAVVEALD